MKAKSLVESNRFLKTGKTAREKLARTVASSTAIETGEPIQKIESKILHPHNSSSRVKLA